MSQYLFNTKTQVTISVVMLLALIGGVWNLSAKATTVTHELTALRLSVDALTAKISDNERNTLALEKRLTLLEENGARPMRDITTKLQAESAAHLRNIDRLYSLLREHMVRTGDALHIPKSSDPGGDVWQQ